MPATTITALYTFLLANSILLITIWCAYLFKYCTTKNKSIVKLDHLILDPLAKAVRELYYTHRFTNNYFRNKIELFVKELEQQVLQLLIQRLKEIKKKLRSLRKSSMGKKWNNNRRSLYVYTLLSTSFLDSVSQLPILQSTITTQTTTLEDFLMLGMIYCVAITSMHLSTMYIKQHEHTYCQNAYDTDLEFEDIRSMHSTTNLSKLAKVLRYKICMYKRIVFYASITGLSVYLLIDISLVLLRKLIATIDNQYVSFYVDSLLVLTIILSFTSAINVTLLLTLVPYFAKVIPKLAKQYTKANLDITNEHIDAITIPIYSFTHAIEQTQYKPILTICIANPMITIQLIRMYMALKYYILSYKQDIRRMYKYKDKLERY